MSRILFLCTIGLLFFNSALYAQIFSTPSTPILRKIIETKGAITIIHQYQSNKFLKIENSDIYDNFSPHQTLIKNDSGLFIMLSGTGQVYRMISRDTASLYFKRIDRTIFAGYNFNAINFSHKNKLISLGGYGFWRINGHLRYFSPNLDWQLIPVNTEVGTQAEIYALFPEEDQIFFISPPYFLEPEGKRTNEQNLAVRLDLNKGNNTILGHVTGIDLPPMFVNLESLHGTLVKQSTGIFLLSWKENKVYKVINNDKFRFITTRPAIIYEYKDSLLYSDSLNTVVKKIALNREDFQMISERPIYQNPSSKYFSSENYIFWLFGLTGCVFGFYFFKKKGSASQKLQSSKQGEVDILEDVHLNLLHFLQDCNNQVIPVTTDAINALLGYEKKPVDLQKRIRRDTINKINSTFQSLYKTENLLIKRIRSKDDRRHFIYLADDAMLRDFLNNLKKGN